MINLPKLIKPKLELTVQFVKGSDAPPDTNLLSQLLVAVRQSIDKKKQQEQLIGAPAPVPPVIGPAPGVPGIFSFQNESQGMLYALLNFISPQLLQILKSEFGVDAILGLSPHLPAGALAERWERLSKMLQQRGFAVQADVEKFKVFLRNLLAALGHKIVGYTADGVPIFEQATEKHIQELSKIGPDAMFLMLMFAPDTLDKMLPPLPGARGTSLRGSLAVALNKLYGTLGSIPDPVTGEPLIKDPFQFSQSWVNILERSGWAGFTIGQVADVLSELAKRGLYTQELAAAPPEVKRVLFGEKTPEVELALAHFRTVQGQKNLQTAKSYLGAIGLTMSLLADLYRGKLKEREIGVPDAFSFLDLATAGSWTSLNPEQLHAIIAEVYASYNKYGSDPKFWANLSNMIAKNLEKVVGQSEFAPFIANAVVRHLRDQVSRGNAPSTFIAPLSKRADQVSAIFIRSLRSQMVNMAGAILNIADAHRMAGGQVNPNAPFWQLVNALEKGQISIGNISLSYMTPQLLEQIALSSGIDPMTVKYQMMSQKSNIQRFMALGQPAMSIMMRAHINEGAKMFASLSLGNPLLRGLPPHILWSAVMDAAKMSAQIRQGVPVAGSPAAISAGAARLLVERGFIPEHAAGSVAAALSPVISQMNMLTGIEGFSVFDYLSTSGDTLLNPQNPVTRQIAREIARMHKTADETRRASTFALIIDSFQRVDWRKKGIGGISDFLLNLFGGIKHPEINEKDIQEMTDVLTGRKKMPPLPPPRMTRIRPTPPQRPEQQPKIKEPRPEQVPQGPERGPEIAPLPRPVEPAPKNEGKLPEVGQIPAPLPDQEPKPPAEAVPPAMPAPPQQPKQPPPPPPQQGGIPPPIDIESEPIIPGKPISKLNIRDNFQGATKLGSIYQSHSYKLAKIKLSDYLKKSSREADDEIIRVIPINEYRKEDYHGKNLPIDEDHQDVGDKQSINEHNKIKKLENQEYRKILAEFLDLPSDPGLSSLQSVI